MIERNQVANRADRPLRGRLAPSPTGAQHLGNARTFLVAWLSLRRAHGAIVLRIEDIDSPRVKPHAADQAIEDLRWLGLDWDEGPGLLGSHGPYVQRQRQSLYQRYFDQLCGEEQVYPCDCTRRDVETAASAPHAEHEGPAYPGTCSHRTVADALRLTAPFCWRFRVPEGMVRFQDRVRGLQECDVRREMGDFVVWKNAFPSYQFAVVMDDALMEIDEVTRGDDLIPSTFRQLVLYQWFGWSPPAFAHVPLVKGSDGRRLAKRHGDTRLASFRDAGVSREELVGLLAWSLGQNPSRRPCHPQELIETFAWENIPRSPWIVEPSQWPLQWPS